MCGGGAFLRGLRPQSISEEISALIPLLLQIGFVNACRQQNAESYARLLITGPTPSTLDSESGRHVLRSHLLNEKTITSWLGGSWATSDILTSDNGVYLSGLPKVCTVQGDMIDMAKRVALRQNHVVAEVWIVFDKLVEVSQSPSFDEIHYRWHIIAFETVCHPNNLKK